MTIPRLLPRLWAPMCLFGLAALTLAGRAEAGVVVAPPTSQNTEGNSDNSYPLSGDPIRYQQVFSASIFPGGKQWITQIAFRPDGPTGRAFDKTLSDFEIHLSTTAKGPDNLSKTFAENVGNDDTIINQGTLHLSSSFGGSGDGPKDFDVVINLENPFLYNPASGNLLLDIHNLSGGSTTQFDAVDTAPDVTSRIWSFDVNSPKADPDIFPSAGLIVRFVTAP